MELPGIPDAKEPDGPEDGIVVLENNLGAAIEVTLDQEVARGQDALPREKLDLRHHRSI